MSSKPESRLSSRIIKTLRAEAPEPCWFAKIPGTAFSAGLPDIIGCVRGRFIAVEVKMPGRENTLTARQAAVLDLLEHAGARVGVVTSVEEALALLSDL
jgi:Holliday junction resolvase